MAEVKMTGGGPEEPTKPVRLPPPDGTYLAKVVGLRHGFTREDPPRPKLTLEWMLLKDQQNKDTQKGRRVWQDYVLLSKGKDDWVEGHLRRLRDLLTIFDIEYSKDGKFDADQLLEKRAWITVSSRKKKEGDKVRTFTDIGKVALPEPLATTNSETLHDDPDDEPVVEAEPAPVTPAPSEATTESARQAPPPPPEPIPPDEPSTPPPNEESESNDDDWLI